MIAPIEFTITLSGLGADHRWTSRKLLAKTTAAVWSEVRADVDEFGAECAVAVSIEKGRRKLAHFDHSFRMPQFLKPRP
jgi:hypothetical protein